MDGLTPHRLLARLAPRRWPMASPPRTLAVLAIALIACPSPATAFEFILVGSGADQHLTWYWESATPAKNCSTQPMVQCGDQASVGGVVASSFNSFNNNTYFQSMTTTSGGSLTWTGEDSLRVVARTALAARAFAGFIGMGPPGYAAAWGAVNARDFPMVFQMVSEPGDPPDVPIRITPRLVGSFTHTTTVGGYTHVMVQMQMTVSVNGVPVSTDALNTEWEYAEGAGGTRVMDFPRGAANIIVIPSVLAGSQISVQIWAYAQIYASMMGAVQQTGQITSTSSFGTGPAIVVVAEPLGVTAVAGEAGEQGQALALSARPNPSSGATRIDYALPRAARVTVSLYDIAGHRVSTLVNRVEGAGRHHLDWDGRDARGRRPAPGIYFVELLADRVRQVERLVVLR